MPKRQSGQEATGPMNRRRVLSTLGTALTAGVAGCRVSVGDTDLSPGNRTVTDSGDGRGTDAATGEGVDPGTEADGWTAEVTDQSFDNWSQYRYDLRNTGHNRVDSGPESGVAIRWEREVGADVRTPVVADGVLYALTIGDGALHALDTETGEPVWTCEDDRLGYERLPEEDARNFWFNTLTPAVANGHVYVSVRNIGSQPIFWGLLAIDAESGELAWEFRTEGVPTSPVVDADGTIYVVTEYLFAIHPDGTRKWGTECLSGHPPAIADGKVYATHGEEHRSGGDLRVFDAENGDVVWEGDVGGNTAPVVVDGRVFLSSLSGVSVYEPVGDGEVVWAEGYAGPEHDLEFWDVARWSPVVAHDNLYLYHVNDFSGDGEYTHTLFAFDAATGEVNWTYDAWLGDRPVAAGDSLYLYDDQRVVCLDPTDGTERWGFDLEVDGPHRSSLVVDDGVIYLSANAGADDPNTIYALEGTAQ